MRFRPQTWFLLSLMFFTAASYFWILGDRKKAEQLAQATENLTEEPRAASQQATQAPAAFPLVSEADQPQPHSRSPSPSPSTAGVKAAPDSSSPSRNSGSDGHPYRLSNSPKPLSELLHSRTAILLRNAIIDTGSPEALEIPEHLRASEDPGSYVVQARDKLDRGYRDQVQQAGAEVVAYIPNNAYLVRASSENAARLEALPDTQSVLPFEPYYKLDSTLLELAVKKQRLPAPYRLNVLLFPGEDQAALDSIQSLGLKVVSESRSPFGRQVVVQAEANPDHLVDLARLPGVQGVEKHRRRQPLNDLTRVRVGVASDTVTTNNYLNLTGSNVVVNINDSGVDASHPDLTGRIVTDTNTITTDASGHGTHVAGIIASSGAGDASVNAAGSELDASFRGMAPGAELYPLEVDLTTGPVVSDTFLQQTAARRTNVFISNNSWNYIDAHTYDAAAASYDAATRDALPDQPGEQPLLFVFAAGNDGDGFNDGTDGDGGTIASPATAKNVITVGAIENLRTITNQVVTTNQMVMDGNVTNVVETNETFLIRTDSNNQVIASSSRGNVGRGTEGPFGRFKPDLVAPGSFIVSTRATNWSNPEFSIDTRLNTILDQSINPGEFRTNSIFVPESARSLQIRVVPNPISLLPLPNQIPIFANPGSAPALINPVGTNDVTLTRGGPLSPGNWFYTLGNTHTNTINYDLQTLLTLTNAQGNFFEELRTLNDRLRPAYRYESGTSMAAPVVSGVLALMQEFFQERLQRPYSPALMKALLINGSRSVNPLYDLVTTNRLNHQGWGLIHITNSISQGMLDGPESSWPIRFFDQDPTNAVATGESQSWRVNIPSEVNRAFPLRLTLVWTDPPGNPAAGLKLVNDLDLVVSNTATEQVFIGNNFPPNNDFTRGVDTNNPPINDVVNNVENVFLEPPLDTNYVVSVVGSRVNVNAVTDHPDGIVQDFALVVSSGNLSNNVFNVQPVTGPDENTLAVEPREVQTITNGIPLLNQRVGAQEPSLVQTNGLTNQWQFFVYTNMPPVGSTNTTAPPNVAFVTFIPPNLSTPRNESSDLDLYVSTDSSLTNLNPAAIQGASKSLGRGGTESVIFTNAAPDAVYYLGVKAEDQSGGDFAVFGVSSEEPFAFQNSDGSQTLRAYPLSAVIEDGSPEDPSATTLISPGGFVPGIVRRVSVNQTLVHELMGDLFGNLEHNGVSVVLNNHTDQRLNLAQTQFVYDDSGQADNQSLRSDGPGSLTDFLGESLMGPWTFTMIDNALNHTGRVENLTMRVETTPPADNTFLEGEVLANTFFFDVIDVPVEATNLVITLSTDSQPLDLYIRRGALPTTTEFDKMASIDPPGGTLTLDLNDSPPLTAGRYFIGVFNPNATAVTFQLAKLLELELQTRANQILTSRDTPVSLLDDALTNSVIDVPDDRIVADVNVGFRIIHPQASDLSLKLISPQGKSVLLAENRGRTNALGYGAGGGRSINYAQFSENPNLASLPVKFAEPPFTNQMSQVLSNNVILNDGFEDPGFGTYNTGEFIGGWEVTGGQVQVTGLAHTGNRSLGLNSGTVSTNVATSNGTRYLLSFAYSGDSSRFLQANIDGVNQLTVNGAGINQWQTTSVVFTAVSPSTAIEFNTPPRRTGLNLDTVKIFEMSDSSYLLAEESLRHFRGDPSQGEWKLEITDTRVGHDSPQPRLLGWKLEMFYARTNPAATPLTNNVPFTNTVAGSAVHYFSVDVPRQASFATNTLTGPNNSLEFFGHRSGLPPLDGSDDYGPIANDFRGRGQLIMRDSGSPPLLPGQRYFLAVRNIDPNTTNQFVIEVEFDQVTTTRFNLAQLANGVAETHTIDPVPSLDYFQFEVSPEASRARFQLDPQDGNAELYLRRETGRTDTLPTRQDYDYRSANPEQQSDWIQIDGESAPVPLEAGKWYLGVLNRDEKPVTYQISAAEQTGSVTNVVQLENAVSQEFTVESGTELTDFFRFDINDPVQAVVFDLFDLSGDADLVVRRNEMPTAFSYDFGSFNFDATDEQVVVRTNSSTIELEGSWFLGVVNHETHPVDFSIRAAVTQNGVLPGRVPLQWTQQPRQLADGSLQLSWASIQGEDYEIEVSSDLETWTVLTHVTAEAATTTIDVNVADEPKQFYRIKQMSSGQ